MAINEIAIDYLQQAITLMQNEAYEVERPSKNGVSFNLPSHIVNCKI